VLRFFPMITTILFWQAVYAGAGEQAQQKFADFSLRQTVAYLLLVHISRMFSSMPGLAGGIARDIRDGNLKKYLLQPLDMIGYRWRTALPTRRRTSRPRFCPTPCCFFSVAVILTACPVP